MTCLSPKHSDISQSITCVSSVEMSPSQYRARRDCRKALLGGQSPARFLVSLGTGDPGSSVAEETEWEAAPPSLSPTQGPPEGLSTCPWEGGEAVVTTKVVPPLPYPRDRDGSTYAPSHEGGMRDSGGVPSDEYPLGWSAFQGSPIWDRTEPPISPLF